MKELKELLSEIKKIRENTRIIEEKLENILRDPELIEFYSPEMTKERRRKEINRKYYEKNKGKS